jgi:hypothetical protein
MKDAHPLALFKRRRLRGLEEILSPFRSDISVVALLVSECLTCQTVNRQNLTDTAASPIYPPNDSLACPSPRNVYMYTLPYAG